MATPPALKGTVISFDTETAVLGDRVIEFGCSVFKDEQLVFDWCSYINPTVPIDPEATEVHHIRDDDVRNAPKFADIAWFIYNQLNSAEIHIAYNYDYDRGVLEKEFARVGMRFPLKPMVDPFIFFKHYHKYNKGKKLVDAAAKYGIKYVGAHRANNDAKVTAQLMYRMAAVKVDFPKDINTLVTKQRRMIEAQFNDFHAYMQRVGRDLPTPPNYKFYEI